MLSFISENNLWLIITALSVAFVSSIITFRLATSAWYYKPTHAKLWLIAGLTNMVLGAWFIFSLCAFASQGEAKVTMLSTALYICILVLITFLIAALDLFLRNHKVSGSVSREHLSKLALIDTLTGLPNRRALMSQLDAAIRRSERSGDSLAVAFIDIDNFKPINDIHGHQVGDQILKAVSKSLVSAVRGCDSIARIGGDEFIALIEEIKTDDDCVVIIERMLNEVRTIQIPHVNSVQISTSIGVAIYPKDGLMPDIMHAADSAMYRAKNDGKNKFKFFDAEIAAASHQLLEIQQDLKHALANDELKLHYQVKIDSHTQEPIGAEALLRWEHPIKGLLYPRDFMHAAERFGLSYAISDWVIEESCRTLHRLNHLHVPFNMSINLSQHQLKNPKLVPEVLAILKRFNLPASQIMFEVTEQVATKNINLFNTLLLALEKAQIQMAIDDFGVTPISLLSLKHLKVHELKLDPAFITDIAQNQKSLGVVQAIIELAHVLELNVVAEGVETEEQRKILADIGCDQMQGYLICHPVSVDRLFEILKSLSLHYESTGIFSMQSLKHH